MRTRPQKNHYIVELPVSVPKYKDSLWTPPPVLLVHPLLSWPLLESIGTRCLGMRQEKWLPLMEQPSRTVSFTNHPVNHTFWVTFHYYRLMEVSQWLYQPQAAKHRLSFSCNGISQPGWTRENLNRCPLRISQYTTNAWGPEFPTELPSKLSLKAASTSV